MTKEEELKLKKDRKKFDIREEYFVRTHLCRRYLYSTNLSSGSAHKLTKIGSPNEFNDQRAFRNGVYHLQSLPPNRT
jgi:hypothetical protein